jgi:hypothetical protein
VDIGWVGARGPAPALPAIRYLEASAAPGRSGRSATNSLFLCNHTTKNDQTQPNIGRFPQIIVFELSD